MAWSGQAYVTTATTARGRITRTSGRRCSIWSASKDTYLHDGRVLIDQLHAWAVPQTLNAHRETLRRLGNVYKQLNAPFGAFGMHTLSASTKAIESGTPADDGAYTSLEGDIASLTAQRDALASQIRAALNAAASGDAAINEQQAKGWISQAEALLDAAAALGS